MARVKVAPALHDDDVFVNLTTLGEHLTWLQDNKISYEMNWDAPVGIMLFHEDAIVFKLKFGNLQ